jgi:hypothetical protein
MDKGLFFLILALTCLWLVFDEFVGSKRISKLAGYMTPSMGGLFKQPEPYTPEEKEEVNKDAKDVNDKVGIPKLGGR